MRDKLNPNPLSKLLATLLLSLGLRYFQAELWASVIVGIFVFFYIVLGHEKKGIKVLLFYGLVIFLVKISKVEEPNVIVTMYLSLLFVLKIFFIPLLAGIFLVSTSDVGSMVSAMDWARVPKAMSIPIATMFRFFPSYKEERKNIAFAMKMRGISLKNPLKYIEYVFVPLLTISSEMADDIAKYAECKALADPSESVRLRPSTFGLGDLIFLGSIGLTFFGAMNL